MLTIGDNIRNNRKKRGMTQENLANLLHVSTTAVSKWESGISNPDVTMLIPLAKTFNTTIDDLLGYNREKEDDILQCLHEYNLTKSKGYHIKAKKMIREAWINNPNNYEIMNEYMWSIVGGKNMIDSDAMKTNASDLMRLSDTILNECDKEKIRIDALLMKAKLLFITDRKTESFMLLNSLPGWDGSYGEKFEQFYENGTTEKKYWEKRNIYSLSDGLSYKIVKFLSYQENSVQKIIELGDLIHQCWVKTKLTAFLVMEHMIFSFCANKLSCCKDNDKNLQYLRDKELLTAEELTKLCHSDSALKDIIVQTYKTDNLFEWTLDFLKSSIYAKDYTQKK